MLTCTIQTGNRERARCQASKQQAASRRAERAQGTEEDASRQPVGREHPRSGSWTSDWLHTKAISESDRRIHVLAPTLRRINWKSTHPTSGSCRRCLLPWKRKTKRPRERRKRTLERSKSGWNTSSRSSRPRWLSCGRKTQCSKECGTRSMPNSRYVGAVPSGCLVARLAHFLLLPGIIDELAQAAVRGGAG
jgi:hypothetical protein